MSETDIQELTAICCDKAAKSVPLAKGHLKSVGASGEPISLVHRRVNALPDDQALDFSKVGLSIIYGDNGSGKSGYRQVIVFTHDLSFLYELRREAEAKSQSIHYQTVHRRGEKPGFIEGELPNKARSALQLANILRSELKTVKHEFDKWPEVRRSVFSKGMIEQTREAWDQAIADFIYPVLGRFDNQIKGGSLYKLAVLQDNDVMSITEARKRLSEDLHASAQTLNPEAVTHAQLVDEVKKLEDWVHDIEARQKAAKAPAVSYAS